MNRLEQAFEDKYQADHRDPMVAEDLARFTDGWSAALSAQQAGTGEPVGSDAFAKGWEEGVAFERSDKEAHSVIADLRATNRDVVSKLEEARSYLERGWVHAAKAQIDFALSVLAGNAAHAKQDAQAVKETWWFKELREFWETDPGAITAAVNMALNHIAATPKAAPAAVSESTLQLQEALHCLSDVMRAATHALIVMPAGERETKLRSVLSKAHDWYMAETAALSPPPSVGEPSTDGGAGETLRSALSKLRHLYANMMRGVVTSTQNIAEGVLAPAIEQLEELAAAPDSQGAAPSDEQILKWWGDVFPERDIPTEALRRFLSLAMRGPMEAERADRDRYFKLYNEACNTAAERLKEIARLETRLGQGAPKPVALTDEELRLIAGECEHLPWGIGSRRIDAFTFARAAIAAAIPSDGAQAAGQARIQAMEDAYKAGMDSFGEGRGLLDGIRRLINAERAKAAGQEDAS